MFIISLMLDFMLNSSGNIDSISELNSLIAFHSDFKQLTKVAKLLEVFGTQFKGTDIGSRAKLGKGLNKAILEKYYNPFSVGMPEKLLNNALKERDMSAKDLAEQMEKANVQKESTTYTHTSGARAISREVAIKYSEILKCDPVDLMFNKVTIPVWGKVNLMQPVELKNLFSWRNIYLRSKCW